MADASDLGSEGASAKGPSAAGVAAIGPSIAGGDRVGESAAGPSAVAGEGPSTGEVDMAGGVADGALAAGGFTIDGAGALVGGGFAVDGAGALLGGGFEVDGGFFGLDAGVGEVFGEPTVTGEVVEFVLPVPAGTMILLTCKTEIL